MQTPYDGSTFLATANQEPLSGNRSFSPYGLAVRSGATASSRYSQEPLIGSNGEFNAGSRKEVMQAIATLMGAASRGEVSEVVASEKANLQAKLERKQALASTMLSTDAATQTALAEVVGESVYETLGRAGFARKFLQTAPLQQGDFHRVPVITPDITTFYSTENINVPASQIRGKVVEPKPFVISNDVLIDNLELTISPVDLLDIKYNQALEQQLRGEDIYLTKLLDLSASEYNEPVYFSTLTPTVLASLRNQIDTQGGIPVGGLLLAADLWADIISDSEFQNFYSPIEKHEIVLTGRLGTLMGMDIVTDGFRIKNLQVLKPGSSYVLGIPDLLGVVGQYGELTVTAIDRRVIGESKRGWFIENTIDMTVLNSRAVVKGQRL